MWEFFKLAMATLIPMIVYGYFFCDTVVVTMPNVNVVDSSMPFIMLVLLLSDWMVK